MLPSDRRLRTRFILAAIIAVTIPCYCLGFVAVALAPEATTPTPISTASLSVPTTPGGPSATPSILTTTITPTGSITPSATPTLTPTPTNTPTPTQTLTPFQPATSTFTR